MGMKLPRGAKVVTPERDVQRACIEFLRLIGAVPIRVNSGAMKSATGRLVKFNHTPGCSDILACVAGRFIAAEVKRVGGKLTPDQRLFLDSVTAAGGIGIVVSSVEALAAALKAEGIDTRGVG